LATGSGDTAFTIGNTTTDTNVKMSKASGGTATYQVMQLNTILTLGSTAGSTTSATHIRGGSSTAGSGLVVKNDGDVGIGHTNPGMKLDISATADDGLRVFSMHNANHSTHVTSGEGGYFLKAFYDAQEAFQIRLSNATFGSGGGLKFEYGGRSSDIANATYPAHLMFSPRDTTVATLCLTHDGKVGIGEASPSDKLDVAGNIAQHSRSFGTTIVNAHSAASTGVNATVEANENRSGVYWLNFNSYKFRAFIRPDWLQGRNWILVAKFFTFSDMPSGSSLWTNDTWVNEGDFDIYSGKFSKYEGWRYFSFNRLAIQMGNRVAPIMQFDSATTLYANFSGGRASNGGGLTADSTDPQIGNSATYHSMEPYIGANFTNMSGSEDMMQSYGLNKWANSATNSTSANNEGSAGLNSDVSQGFQLTVEDAHRHTAGQDSVGVAGAWIGCPMDEGGFTFGGDSSNSGSDSGFGMGIGCGNAARTATSGIAEWAQGNRVANYLPAYIWVSID